MDRRHEEFIDGLEKTLARQDMERMTLEMLQQPDHYSRIAIIKMHQRAQEILARTDNIISILQAIRSSACQNPPKP